MKRLLKQLKILILEDVATDAELMERELRRAKIWYTTLRVDTRRGFEEALEQFGPDLILADYNLPAFDGVTALRIAHSRVPDVPFIFVSGSIGEERAVEALRHGATDYIIKDRLQRLAPAVLRAMEEVTARAERRRADAALRTSEERFRAIAAATTDGIWDWTLRTDQVWLSEALRTLLGYPDAPEFVTPDWLYSRIHPQDLPGVRAHAERRVREQLAFSAQQYRFRRGDEEWVMVLERSRLLRDDHDMPARIVAALADITDKIRAEQIQQAQFTITRLIAEGEDFGKTMNEILATWCTGTGGDAATLWLHDAASNRLKHFSAWAPGSDREAIQAAAVGKEFHQGESIPGRVWQQGTAVECIDLSAEPAFQRAPQLSAAGFKSAFAFPITAGKDFLGVLECFRKSAGRAEDHTREVARDIGTRIGMFLLRNRADEQLRRRAAFEELIATISSNFISQPAEQIYDTIQRAIEQLGQFAEVDRVHVLLVNGRKAFTGDVLEWCAPGIRSALEILEGLPATDRSWTLERVARGQTVAINRIAELPEKASREREYADSVSLRSFLAEPLVHEGTLVGILGFEMVREERVWTAADISLIRITGQILSNALGRKLSEDRVRKSESMLALAQSQAHLGSWELDLTTGQLAWSDELYRIFDVEPAQFTPTIDAVLERVHPDDRDRVRKQMSTERRTSSEYRILRPDGVIRVLQGTQSMIMDPAGRGFRVIGSALDITELHQASETIQRLSRQNKLILQSVGEGIFGLDPWGVVTFVNPAAARMLGWRAEELIGKSFQAVAQYARADGTPYAWEETPAYVSLIRGTTETREEVFWRRDGSSVQVEYTTTPIIDEQGNRLGAVVTFRDIEERRLMEKQLEQANRLSSLGRVAATIAHEFNNVLMGIQPFAELIRKIGGSEPKIQKAAEQIARSVQRGKGISQEILRFTRPAQPNMQPIDLQEWFADFVSEMRALLGENIEFKVSIPPEKLIVLGDPLQLQQVFNNLVVNARDAMAGRGSISMDVHPPSSRSVFPFGVVPNPEQYVHLIVSDTGPGMNREVLNRIFEPLFTTKKTGTGLGLAVAHQIVMQHRGHIFADSEMAKGSSFHIFLPAEVAGKETAGSGERVSSAPAELRARLRPSGKSI